MVSRRICGLIFPRDTSEADVKTGQGVLVLVLVFFLVLVLVLVLVLDLDLGVELKWISVHVSNLGENEGFGLGWG